MHPGQNVRLGESFEKITGVGDSDGAN